MIENTSGFGEYSEIPEEAKKWNWGAFWLTWIWGIGNKSYISFLAVLPVVNLIMPFYLGMKGNELAWKNNRWYDVADLQSSQKKWAIAGWIIGLIFITVLGVRGFNEYNAAKQSEKITNEIMEMILNDEQAKEIINEDYEIMFAGNLTADIPEFKNTEVNEYNIILKSDYEIYSIEANLGINNEVTNIKISEFGDEGDFLLNISNK